MLPYRFPVLAPCAPCRELHRGHSLRDESRQQQRQAGQRDQRQRRHPDRDRRSPRLPTAMPTVAAKNNEAAVVNPCGSRSVLRSMIAPAPMNPMPVTTACKARVGSPPSRPSATASSLRIRPSTTIAAADDDHQEMRPDAGRLLLDLALEAEDRAEERRPARSARKPPVAHGRSIRSHARRLTVSRSERAAGRTRGSLRAPAMTPR